jgi:hypothetical protein
VILDEKHKYFKLMKPSKKKHTKGQPSDLSNVTASSFDSINPNELVLPTQTGCSNSNYASNVSGTNRYHNRLNTRSSGMSSVYQLTNEAETERGEPLKVDKILNQIDDNINTFTIA